MRILWCSLHRYEELQRADAVNSNHGLVHNLCATPSSIGALLWACSGAGTASIYSIQGKSLVRKVGGWQQQGLDKMCCQQLQQGWCCTSMI